MLDAHTTRSHVFARVIFDVPWYEREYAIQYAWSWAFIRQPHEMYSYRELHSDARSQMYKEERFHILAAHMWPGEYARHFSFVK
jgi:hypothetical protein